MSLLVIGADHGGFQLKEALKTTAVELGWPVQDVGTHSTEAVDYPDVAHRVALAVLGTPGALGVMVDGAGVGSAMAAGKVPGIRAAVCNELYTARNAREHNHANLLCLGSQVVGVGVAREILRTFVTAQPLGDRHARRVEKIRELERGYAAAAGGVTPALVERVLAIVLETLKPGASGVASPGVSAAGKAVGKPGASGAARHAGARAAGASTPAVAPARGQRPGGRSFRPVLSERDVLAADRSKPLLLAPGTLVTPQARDTAQALGLKLQFEPSP